MIKNYDIAIDLGSKYTVIYKVGLGVVLKEPSVVAVKRKGKKIILVCAGLDALKLIVNNEEGVELICPIENGVIKNREVVSLMLKYFFEQIEENKIYKSGVIILVPFGLTENEKSTYIHTAYSLDIRKVSLIPHSICALVGMGVSINEERHHMVVNIGGNLTNIAIISAGRITNGCSLNIGGDSINNIIKDYILQNYLVEIDDELAEELKIETATLLNNDIKSFKFNGINSGTRELTDVEIKSQDIVFIFANVFKTVIGKIIDLLQNCSDEELTDIHRSGIYLCGGTTQITGLEKFLRTNLGLPVYIDVDPENTIIFGAGTLLNQPAELNKIVKMYSNNNF